ncbi:DUF7283 family protein [Haloarcula rara]|uniref:DUF7283 family protein n=1 Tax=Haloarcula rara TaxID=3033387 RepID=UPI0023E76F85|nr:hypothetical protein [Halomicroarcula sp. SHR3]
MEAFADRWVMFMGLTLFTTAVLGLVLSMQTVPAPDANEAANTIDSAAGSKGGTHAEYDHDAEEVRVRAQSFSLRNEGGTSSATVAFGSLVPVNVGDNHYDRLEQILLGEQWQDVFDDEAAFRETSEEATQNAVGNEEWRETSGTLRVTTEVVDGEQITIVAF